MLNQGKISSLRRNLLLIFEEMIGDSCYNGNIQNYGPGGEWESEGRHFRYPITFVVGSEQRFKTWLPRDHNISDTVLLNGHYRFGANELHIMYALDQILDTLEWAYGIDLGGSIEASQEDSKDLALRSYIEGRLAYKRGFSVAVNPYDSVRSPVGHSKWLDGWWDAEKGRKPDQSGSQVDEE